MKPIQLFFPFLLLSTPCRAAVSILIEPGVTSATSSFTVTQTSDSPLLLVAGIEGYGSGMSIPSAIFNIGASSVVTSDIYGGLGASVAAITEGISGQTFSLTGIQIAADPSNPSLLGFDHLFTLPTGHSTIQFEAETAGPVETNIPFYVLNLGTWSVEDTLWGTVTVTVVPEPSGLALFSTGVGALATRLKRRG